MSVCFGHETKKRIMKRGYKILKETENRESDGVNAENKRQNLSREEREPGGRGEKERGMNKV